MTDARKSPFSLLWFGAAVLGALGIVAAWFLEDHARFWSNWILWFIFLFTTALGCLFLVALEHLVAAKWSVPLRRVPERLSTLLLPLTPVALIALAAMPVLYPGSWPEAANNRILAGKVFWLGVPFVSIRTIACLILCLLSVAILVRGSVNQDQSKDPNFNLKARKFAPGFMAIFAFVVTILAFDWISALTPEWYSDVFGVYLFAGGFLSGLAATSLLLVRMQRQGRLQDVNDDHRYSLGGFMFAFTVFWSYIAFAQYMLMWYGNLPEEVGWYRDRLVPGWHGVTIALAILHFFVPFFALVTRDSKGDRRGLYAVAILMLGAHALDVYWLIFPSLGHGVLFSWPEVAFALFFLGGAVLWTQKMSTWGEDMPVGDPFLKQGLEFRL